MNVRIAETTGSTARQLLQNPPHRENLALLDTQLHYQILCPVCLKFLKLWIVLMSCQTSTTTKVTNLTIWTMTSHLSKRKRRPLRRVAKRPPPSISKPSLNSSFKTSSAKRSIALSRLVRSSLTLKTLFLFNLPNPSKKGSPRLPKQEDLEYLPAHLYFIGSSQ